MSSSPLSSSTSSSLSSASSNINEIKMEMKDLEEKIDKHRREVGNLKTELKDIEDAIAVEKKKGKEERDEDFMVRKKREADRTQSDMDTITGTLIALQNHYQRLISSSPIPSAPPSSLSRPLPLPVMRRALLSAGCDIDERVITMIKHRSSLNERLRNCENVDDFVRLYEDVLSRFGTSTKRLIVGVDETMRIYINGEFSIPQESSSIFYHAVCRGVPCILKFPSRPSIAVEECRIANSVSSQHDGKRFLTPIELVRIKLEDPSPSSSHHHRLPRDTAIKMNVYIGTLLSYPADSRLVKLFSTAAVSCHEALKCLHSSGVVHSDVKPSNIFVDANGNCYLGDFDASLRLNEKIGRTTEAFLPMEFSLLHHQHFLIASPCVDFAMLACSLAFMMSFKRPKPLTSSLFTVPSLRAIVQNELSNLSSLTKSSSSSLSISSSSLSSTSSASSSSLLPPSFSASLFREEEESMKSLLSVISSCLDVVEQDVQYVSGSQLLQSRIQSTAAPHLPSQSQSSSSESPMETLESLI